MAGLLTNPHARRLEALRHVRHVLQGEPPSIQFLKLNRSTGALETSFWVDTGWTYGDRDADGNALPPGVLFELQVSEESITVEDVMRSAAVQHGEQIFVVVRPSPFEPAGLRRFWRFWLAPSEKTT